MTRALNGSICREHFTPAPDETDKEIGAQLRKPAAEPVATTTGPRGVTVPQTTVEEWREKEKENLGSEHQALPQHHHSSLNLLSLALVLVSDPIQVHFVLITGLLPWVLLFRSALCRYLRHHPPCIMLRSPLSLETFG